MRFTTQLLPSRAGNLGILELNNPRPLHALTLDMIYCLQDVLPTWYADDTLVAILLKSSKNTKIPAFCAGGDVKSVYQSGIDDKNVTHGQGAPGVVTSDFFRHEYWVNYTLATARIPQVSLWDGLVMGGGVGLSIHGRYRVATQNAVLAMPETAIGLFPDVGSLWWMPRLLEPGVAVYLALTGQRLQPADLVFSGLATHYVPSEELDALQDALVMASKKLAPTATTKDVVAPVLMSFHQQPEVDPRDSFLAQQRSVIEQVFGPSLTDRSVRVEDIMVSLNKLDCDFGKQTLETLEKMSPTSLKITLEGLRCGATMPSIGDDFVMEFRLAQACMRNSDFYEGIRAVLVDKDNNPRWNPDNLQDVTDEMVESYFAPIGYEWEIPSPVVSSKL